MPVLLDMEFSRQANIGFIYYKLLCVKFDDFCTSVFQISSVCRAFNTRHNGYVEFFDEASLKKYFL